MHVQNDFFAIGFQSTFHSRSLHRTVRILIGYSFLRPVDKYTMKFQISEYSPEFTGKKGTSWTGENDLNYPLSTCQV